VDWWIGEFASRGYRRAFKARAVARASQFTNSPIHQFTNAPICQRAWTRTIRQAPSDSLRSNVHLREAVRSPPPILGVQAAVPEQSARAARPLTFTLQLPNDTRCEARPSNARDNAC